MAIKHVFSNAIADGTNTNIVRPSDWNSGHNLIYALSGNTAGSSQVSGLDVIFKGGNNITLSADTANSQLVISGADVSQYLTTAAQSNHSHGNPTLSLAGGLSGATASNSAGFTLSLTQAAAAAAPFNFSAGTTSNLLSAVTFDNSNGVSFGLSGSVITGSVNNAGTGATLGTRAGINMVATLNSGGLSLEYPNALTTAMQSNAVTLSNIRISGGTTSNLLSALTFADGGGVSFGLNAGTLTATVATNYQSQGAYLTTAMASNRGSDFVQATATFAGTNASGTIASNGISVSVAAPIGGMSEIYFGNIPNFLGTNKLYGTGAQFNIFATRNITTSGINSTAAGVYGELQPTLSNLGNTAGNTGTYAGPLVLVGSNNITLSQSTGTFTTGATSVSGTRATITVLGPNLSQYLTTAMASNRGSDFVQATAVFAGTNASGTIASNGISVSVGNYITTAMLSNAVTLSNIRVSGGTTSNLLSAITFADSNGVSFGLNAGTLTATVATNYQSQGAYLTTAMQSNAATISNINFSAGTTSQNLSKLTFADSNGVSFGLNGSVVTATVKTDYQSAGAYLTTAMQSNAATISNINFSAGTTSQNLSKLTFADSNGVSFGLNGSVVTATVATNYQSAGAYLTTAMLSNAVTISNINFSAGTTSGNLSALTFADGGGVSFGLNAGTVTATVQTNYLTTAAQSNHSHGDPTLALTNLSGTTASASNGFTLSLSAAKPVMDYYVNAVPFLNSQTMTVGQSTSHVVPMFVQENLSFDFLRLIGSGSVSAASTTAVTTGATTFSYGYTKSHNLVVYSRGTGANSGSLQSYYSTQIVEQYSNNVACAANSTQFSYSNRYTLPCSTGTTGFTHDYSSSANSRHYNSASATMLTGLKHLDLPFGTTLSPGMWWICYGQSSATASNATSALAAARLIVTYNFLGMSQATIQIGPLGSATQQTNGLNFGNGSFSLGGAAGITASLDFTNITTSASNNMMYFQLMRTQ